CDLPCLPGRGAYVSLNARWSSPPGVFVLGPRSGSFTFIGRAGQERVPPLCDAGSRGSASPTSGKAQKSKRKTIPGMFVSFVKPIRFEDFTYAFGRRSSVRHR